MHSFLTTQYIKIVTPKSKRNMINAIVYNGISNDLSANTASETTKYSNTCTIALTYLFCLKEIFVVVLNWKPHLDASNEIP